MEIMMQLEIDPTKPWLKELKRIKLELVYQSLKQCDGNRSQASKLLGCSPRNINFILDKNPSIYVKPSQDIKTPLNEITVKRIKAMFELSYTINEICDRLKLNPTTIRSKLESMYSTKEFKKKVAENKISNLKRRQNMLNTDEILDNNRALLSEIASKVRDKKIEELSEEHLVYAQILFRNGFMDKDGTVTQEGIDALHH